MGHVITDILAQMEHLFEEKQYLEVLMQLGEIDRESISPEMKAYHCLLEVKAKYFSGNYDVDSSLRYTLDFYRTSRENDKFALAKYLQGLVLIARGQHQDARESLLEAYAGYKRCEDVSGQARVLNNLSFISFQLGDVWLAIKQLKQALGLYEQIRDEINIIKLSRNLATLFYSSGEISSAIELYEKFGSEVIEHDRRSSAIFYCNYAVALALAGKAAQALKIIAEARPLLEDLDRERAIFHENMGWIHTLDGEYKTAVDCLKQGLEIAEKIAPESTLASQIHRRLADAFLGMNQLTKAQSHCSLALPLAKHIGERIEVAACQRIMARIDDLRGAKKEAKELYETAISGFENINSNYELAVTREYAALSGVFEPAERQALLYLARTYFDRERIPRNTLAQMDNLGQTPPLADRAACPAIRPPDIIAVDPAMREILRLAKQVADSEMSVLLTGETGTGKDLMARYIHMESGRQGEFVSINSAAIPNEMIEAELFGYRKGTFTGAISEKRGLIEEADCGTLYLNEIADATPALQAKLLDALERRRIRRLGETRERPVAFRLIAATNHDLNQLLTEKKFRLDLYHRINDVLIALPPLRQRRCDIPELVRYFLDELNVDWCKERELMDQMSGHFIAQDWPGNIRQLQGAVRKIVVQAQGTVVRAKEFLNRFSLSERDILFDLLNKNGWNRREVARQLNISEGTIRKRIKKYHLKHP